MTDGWHQPFNLRRSRLVTASALSLTDVVRCVGWRRRTVTQLIDYHRKFLRRGRALCLMVPTLLFFSGPPMRYWTSAVRKNTLVSIVAGHPGCIQKMDTN